MNKNQEIAQRMYGIREDCEFTQQQVADLLGLTQVKVSREEKKIMAFMRERLS